MNVSSTPRLKFTARLFVFSWFFIGGICHFAIPEPFLRIMPPYIPYHLACVYISGAFELLGAVSIWLPSLRTSAGYGLMLLTAIVTLANVEMFLHPNLFPSIPYWLLVARFPIQGLLIWLIWWSTKSDTVGSLTNAANDKDVQMVKPSK